MSDNNRESRSRRDTDSAIKPKRLAKVTPPRLRNALRRERLFRMLDDLRDQPLLWLSAPAGAGKTTLIASWAAAHESTLVWFQCDEGDGDLAAFFHFLSLTLTDVTGAQAESLPRLTPDLYAALTIFARNYCREFFSRLKTPALVVFDNWQDVPASAPLRELLPIMMEEVPRGTTLVILSREGPDARFSRALSTGHMTVLGWSELQLTEAETNDLVAQYEPMPDQHTVPSAHDIYAASHGWAAGAAVLLRRELPISPPDWSERSASHQRVFDYLASEVFDRLEPAVQDFMLKTACLKSVSVDVAHDVTGNESARQILERLVNRNVFTVQRPGSGSYEYHPLLREFLKNCFVAQSGMPAWRQLESRIAEALGRHGQPEAAIGLLLEAAAWTDAATLIMNMAPVLAEQGRFKTLIDWITAVPEQERQSLPWLKYWLGASQLVSGIAAARSTLEAAYVEFVEQQDVVGQMLCAVDIVQFYGFELADFEPMAVWLRRLGELLDQKPMFPSDEIEARICAGYIGGLSIVQLDSASMVDYVDRLLVLIDTIKDVHSRAHAMVNLMTQLFMNGDTIRFAPLRPIVDSLLVRRDVAPALQVQLKWAYAHMALHTGDVALAHVLLDDIALLATTIDNPMLSIRTALAGLQATDHTLHQQAVDRKLLSLAPIVATAPCYLRGHFAYVQALAHFSRKNYRDAIESTRQSYEICIQMHFPLGQMVALMLQAEIRCELNQLDEAGDCLNEVENALAHARSSQLEFNFCLTAAKLARCQGDVEGCDRQLRKALAIGRSHQYAGLFHRCPLLFRYLIPVALERGIETEYCLQLIAKLDLRPSSPDSEHWPWPIKIYSLGRFEIIVDGEKLASGGRTQHKPLDLLKALLTNRTGFNSAALLEQLWPDLDGDAARNALNLALHRLRRLLKRSDAVVTNGGNLVLNPDQVWVDAWALEILCDEPPPEAKATVDGRLAAFARLSRGNFLADQDAPWVFSARDRLRSKLTRMLQRYAGVVQDSEQWLSLAHLYQQLIDADPVNEALHHGLIQSYRTQGLDGDALTAYRRYHQLMQRLLGREPPAAARALVNDLL